MKLYTSLEKTLTAIKKALPSPDIFTYRFMVGRKEYAVAYADGLSDKELIGEQIIRPLSTAPYPKSLSAAAKKLFCPEVKEERDFTTLTDAILGGDCAVFTDGTASALLVGLRKYTLRAVAEPPTSTVIKGPREGFIEDMKTNASLVRRRLKSPDLMLTPVTVGKYSQTAVTLCYLSSVVKKGLVERIQAKLNRIDIDGIIDSSYLSRFLSARKDSIFRQVGTTEKPDVLAAKMLEGRVGILVDGSPIALTLPYVVLEDFQSPEDYFNSAARATVSRMLRITAILLSVLLPALFVSAQLFHLQLIPLNFLLTIVNSIKGIPLSPSFEMFFTLLIFEILNEASVRMPKYVGMALSIVGALVLGDTAVRAGIVSTPTIMIMALSGISMYTVPELVETFSLLRIAFLFLAGSLGSYGIIAGGAFLLVYLVTLENFGVPVLSPYAPLIASDLKDSVIKGQLTEMRTRPKSIGSPNRVRYRKKSKKEDA